MTIRHTLYSFMAGAATALLLAACSEASEFFRTTPAVDYDAPLSLTASAGQTGQGAGMRAASTLYDATTGFAGGEQVHVYMYRNNNTAAADYDVAVPADVAGIMTSDLTLHTGEQTIYYPYGDVGTINLYGIYPHGSTDSHTVHADQSADADYQASDLMFAKTLVSWNNSEEKQALKPNLEFEHQLVKLRLTIVKSKEVKQLTRVTMKNVRRQVSIEVAPDAMTLGTPATADENDNIIISSGEPASDDEETYVYGCVFPAQAWGSLDENTHEPIAADFLTVEADGGTATYQLQRDTWQQGYEYKLTISLNPYTLGVTSLISNWTDNEHPCTINATRAAGGTLKIEAVADQNYNDGNEVIPSPAPKVYNASDVEMTPETDYTLNYYNNKEAGSALIVALGQGTYEGQLGIGSFNILSKSITGGYIETLPDVIYNGTAFTPTGFSVYDSNGKKLNPGTLNGGTGTADYTVSYADNLNAGTATVTVTATEDGNYTTGETLTQTFKILPRNIQTFSSDIPVTLEETEYDFNGFTHTNTVSVIDNGLATGSAYTLQENTDYTVGGTISTDRAGTHTVTVTGKGNYTGTRSATWQVGSGYVTITAKAQTVSYGTAIATDVSQVDVEGLPEGYTLTGITLKQSRTNAGTGTITPSAAVVKKGDTDVTNDFKFVYNTGVLTIEKLRITDWSIPSTLSVSIGQTTSITINYGSGSNGDHGDVSSSSSNESLVTASGVVLTGVAEGSATVTVSVGEGTNYIYDGTRTCTVKAYPEPTLAWLKSQFLAGVNTNNYVGWCVATDGSIFESLTACEAKGKTPGGVICYIGNGAEATYPDYKILVLSQSSSGKAKWSTTKALCCERQCTSDNAASTDYNGLKNTDKLLSDGHSHPAASTCRNNPTARPDGASAWFLPSMGQFWLMYRWLYWKQNGKFPQDFKGGTNITSILSKATPGETENLITYDVWSSTERNSNKAHKWATGIDYTGGIFISNKTDGGSAMKSIYCRSMYLY